MNEPFVNSRNRSRLSHNAVPGAVGKYDARRLRARVEGGGRWWEGEGEGGGERVGEKQGESGGEGDNELPERLMRKLSQNKCFPIEVSPSKILSCCQTPVNNKMYSAQNC